MQSSAGTNGHCRFRFGLSRTQFGSYSRVSRILSGLRRHPEYEKSVLGSIECLSAIRLRALTWARLELWRAVRDAHRALPPSHPSIRSIESRDELIFARNHDRGLALLKLDRLCPVANRQPDCSERVLAPPRTYPLLQLNEFFTPRVVARPPRDRRRRKFASWASRFCCSRRWLRRRPDPA